jgi:2-iminobutanoate/2-iminopropanoate deaminase
MKRKNFSGAREQLRAYSPLVSTEGGRVLWLAGHGGRHDDSGKSLAADFDAQVRQTFASMAATLAQDGGTLQDIVTMTVYILDVRHGDRFVELRKEYFQNGFPASTLLTVAGFAKPDMMIEITAIAVVAA